MAEFDEATCRMAGSVVRGAIAGHDVAEDLEMFTDEEVGRAVLMGVAVMVDAVRALTSLVSPAPESKGVSVQYVHVAAPRAHLGSMGAHLNAVLGRDGGGDGEA